MLTPRLADVKLRHQHGWLHDNMLTNPTIPYDLCVGVPISHQLTRGSTNTRLAKYLNSLLNVKASRCFQPGAVPRTGLLRVSITSRKPRQPLFEALLLTAATNDTASGLHSSDQLALITTSPSPCRCTQGIPSFNVKK